MEGINFKLLGIVTFFVSCIVGLYWFLVNVVNVYKTIVTGAVAELFWFPMLILLFVLPILTIFVILLQKGKVSKLWYLSLVLQIITLTLRFLI